MDCKKVRVLRALSRVKEFAEKGDISNAKREMLKVEEILDEKERNALMNTFVRSVVRYNEGIEWNDICHS